MMVKTDVQRQRSFTGPLPSSNLEEALLLSEITESWGSPQSL
jgi:hypothetical protein